ncbi:MAG TPA: hypothetical protein VKA21_15860 [Candidatus Binatia bacterium]|nr:hypothetical protein [Candidatus Binatia bacterium]
MSALGTIATLAVLSSLVVLGVLAVALVEERARAAVRRRMETDLRERVPPPVSEPAEYPTARVA